MKKTLIIAVLTLVVYYVSLAQEVEVLGNVQANSIKLLNGAANNKILVSDADGDATWGDAPSRKRSIVLAPGMINDLLSGAVRGTVGWFESIDMPDIGDPTTRINVPMPADYKGGNLTIKILYSNTSNVGDVRLDLLIRGVAEGGDLTLGPGGDILLPPPSLVDHLASGERVQNVGPGFTLANNSSIITLVAIRYSNHILDTSTGILKILGFVITYDD